MIPYFVENGMFQRCDLNRELKIIVHKTGQRATRSIKDLDPFAFARQRKKGLKRCEGRELHYSSRFTNEDELKSRESMETGRPSRNRWR